MYCGAGCVKAGKRKMEIQTYRCQSCKKYQQDKYVKGAYQMETNQRVVNLLVEGISIRGIARVLRISITTVINRIRVIAKTVKKTFTPLKQGVYEMDELWTFIGNKKNETWITYCIDRKSKKVMDFSVGSRTKELLHQVLAGVLMAEPKKVCTDGLRIYKSLIPESLHRVGLPNTRHIERFNLNLRTHLKRLSRKTICFSRSKEMLEACLKIYFWRSITSIA
jgi:insertion element IS1 protein InsB